jgi:hypothetical protein
MQDVDTAVADLGGGGGILDDVISAGCLIIRRIMHALDTEAQTAFTVRIVEYVRMYETPSTTGATAGAAGAIGTSTTTSTGNATTTTSPGASGSATAIGDKRGSLKGAQCVSTHILTSLFCYLEKNSVVFTGVTTSSTTSVTTSSSVSTLSTVNDNAPSLLFSCMASALKVIEDSTNVHSVESMSISGGSSSSGAGAGVNIEAVVEAAAQLIATIINKVRNGRKGREERGEVIDE